MAKAFTNGNIALVNGAIFWGIESASPKDGRILFAAGYPITPVNDVTEYFGRLSGTNGIVFIQAESEVAAGNMLIGAASTGVPALTVTSSPGISLMQEAISYAAGMELGGRGLVYADVVRGGPGLGNIQGSQSDFNQAVLGGGHGDYRLIVLAPASTQEMFDFARLAFKLSCKHRIPGFILSDGYVGQLKERYEIPDRVAPFKTKVDNDVRTSIFVREGVLEQHNWKLLRRFEELQEDPELLKMAVSPYRLEDPDGDAEIVIVSYGFFSRIGASVVDRAREMGLPVGQLSLKSLSPFPEKHIQDAVKRFGALYVLEGSAGQLTARVAAAAGTFAVVGSCQRPGGTLPQEKEITADLAAIINQVRKAAFAKDLKEHVRLAGQERPFRVNRGERFSKLSIDASSHAVEYAASMEGKRPEPRTPESMTDRNMYYCAGCDHKHTTEALGALFDRFKDREVTLYSPVGCSIFLYDFFRKDRVHNIQVPHGRGPAAASASKRSRPGSLVICYQGDGDALDIGLGELIHASARGENITVVIINNGTYGMTGGQLSATTPVSQFSKSTPKGRDPKLNGYPIDVSQLLHRKGVSYFRRTLVGTPDLNKKFAHHLMQALLHQMKGDGMSVIEVIAACTEHQRAPQEIIDAFQAAGKKMHQIALSKEYAAKTLPQTFGLEAGWGEDFPDPDAVSGVRDAEPPAVTAGEREEGFLSTLGSMNLLSGDAAGDDRTERRFYISGEGGQGVQSLADVLMKASRTKFVFNSPWYEPEVTKARTVAAVTLSSRAQANPNPESGEVEVLICMTPQMYHEKLHYVKEGGLVLLDPMGAPIQNGQFRHTLIQVPASVLAAQAGEKRSANMVFLGALNQALEIFEDTALEDTIRRQLPKAAETNLAAYRLGKEFVISESKRGR